MKGRIGMMPKAKQIDMDYFNHYGGYRNAYKDCWHLYSYADRCVDTQRKLRLKVRKLCILGIASGEVAQHFIKRDKYEIYGCENFVPMYVRIPDFLLNDSKILLADMRAYVQDMPDVDLIFSNSLVYLDEEDVIPTLVNAALRTKYFYFSAPSIKQPDKYRVINRSRGWWDRQFKKAGYKKIGRNMWKTKWRLFWDDQYGFRYHRDRRKNGKRSTVQKAKKKTFQRNRKKRQSK